MVTTLNPLSDRRWVDFLNDHPQASVFHTKGWLRALQLTYGYEPVVFTTSRSSLENGIVACHVDSWLTGRRLVSLPFSDHCQPLGDLEGLRRITGFLSREVEARGWKYVELRPVYPLELDNANFSGSAKFKFQSIDLRPDSDKLFARFHDSCIRRKIRRAQRESLSYEVGRSESLLKKFCHLLLLTRRRHKLPPQPVGWFHNLIHCLGDSLAIHVLSNGPDPVASILTLRHRKTLVYKYGCSDSQFHRLGGTPLLFWIAIQQAKEEGFEEFDLGRSAVEDPGLITFKQHLGAVSAEITYYRSPAPAPGVRGLEAGSSWARQAVAFLPNPVFARAGSLLYRHLG